MGKEILTLQFGSYANHIGTHFWNIQDEMLGSIKGEEDLKNHEYAFDRVYVSTDKGSFPRAMIFDTKSAFLDVPQYGENEEGVHEYVMAMIPLFMDMRS